MNPESSTSGMISEAKRPSDGLWMETEHLGAAESLWEPMWAQLGLPNEQGVNKALVCLDNQPPDRQKKTALVWVPKDKLDQPETYTFAQLAERSNLAANVLKQLGVEAGQRVFLFMERVPELFTLLFGTLKRQAIATPIFAAFGPEAILDRAITAEPVLIITTPALRPRIDEMLNEYSGPRPKVLVVNRQAKEADLPTGYFDYLTLLEQASTAYDTEYTAPDTYSVMHFTSGTTGKPKGAVHTHQAIVAQAATAQEVLDLRADDVYWCTADPGWVTGTAYGMFGPWALGVTQVIYEGGFSPDVWYQLLQDYKVTVWYTAPTAIRMLMKHGKALPAGYKFDSLRHLASVGEPLNPEALVWGREVFGLDFHDTWWQTETGCQHIVNRPGLPIKDGSMGKPLPGVEAAVLDEQFNPLPLGSEGALAVKSTSPSFFPTYWRQESKYNSRFKKGWYLTGDRARVDEDGYFWFVGREDDVINTAGHLVGPFEVESVLVEHEAVAEAGVIGLPDPERLEIIKAYVSLTSGYEASQSLEQELMQFVRQRLAAHAQPRQIEVIDTLPKTRSGKIMRRLLKAQALGQPLGDTSTLEA